MRFYTISLLFIFLLQMQKIIYNKQATMQKLLLAKKSLFYFPMRLKATGRALNIERYL